MQKRQIGSQLQLEATCAKAEVQQSNNSCLHQQELEILHAGASDVRSIAIISIMLRPDYNASCELLASARAVKCVMQIP